MKSALSFADWLAEGSEERRLATQLESRSIGERLNTATSPVALQLHAGRHEPQPPENPA